MKIHAEGNQELAIKRFYLPITANVKCPVCGKEDCKLDLNKEYLSYPILNTKETTGVYCEDCDEYFDKEIILRISIEI